jgi:hypothetical protein
VVIMNNLEQFIIKSFTAPNWFIYLITICIPIIILGIISEIFKISEEKPKVNILFNTSCIVLPLLAVLITYYIKPEYKTLESLNQHYNILITEGDGKILLKYDLKENKTLLSDNRTIIIRKENEKYYAKIGSKETETTLNEIKDVVKKSKNKKIEEKLTLKDLGENNDK